jgi:hypothetical protein
MRMRGGERIREGIFCAQSLCCSGVARLRCRILVQALARETRHALDDSTICDLVTVDGVGEREKRLVLDE